MRLACHGTGKAGMTGGFSMRPPSACRAMAKQLAVMLLVASCRDAVCQRRQPDRGYRLSAGACRSGRLSRYFNGIGIRPWPTMAMARVKLSPRANSDIHCPSVMATPAAQLENAGKIRSRAPTTKHGHLAARVTPSPSQMAGCSWPMMTRPCGAPSDVGSVTSDASP